MKLFLALLLSLPFFPLVAQKKIYTKSSYQYIYKINYDQARKIYKENSLSKIDNSYFTILIDSLPSNHWRSQLPPGNYLFVKSQENFAVIENVSRSKLVVNLLNNHTDFNLAIHDVEGKLIKDAIVKIDGKTISYNEAIQVYHLKNANEEGFLEVQHPKGNHFFELNKSPDGSLLLRNISNIILKKPARFIHKKLTTRYDGYLVFNKPKYLPKDTVKLKAFLVKNHKPITKTLELILRKDQEAPHTLAELKPTSEGAYVHEFVLGDSLDIDCYYEVLLTNHKDKKKFFVQNVFYLEDYQLDEAVYEISTDKTNYHPTDSITLFITSKDANGLPLPDAKADIRVKTKSVNQFYEDETYIDFTLWTHQQALDPDGETRIRIPNSNFPNANLELQVIAQLSNSNYEAQEKETRFYFDKKPREAISIRFSNTMIRAAYLKDGKETPAKGAFYTSPGGDDKEISFPYEEEINPYVNQYTFKQNKTYGYVYMNQEPSLIDGYSRRTKDSAIFELDNPRQLEVYYSVYKNKKKIASGSGKELLLKYGDKKENDYSVALQFIWAGKAETLDYCICHDPQKLTIRIDQPEKVLPGEKTKISIEVRDHLQNPVKNVNLTAFAVNSQLGEVEIPDIKYGELPSYKGRHSVNFNMRSKTAYVGNRLLNDEWRNRLHLDTQNYYKMVFPKPEGYIYVHPATLSQTQFAPFVFNKGMNERVYMIKVDGKYIYYYTGAPQVQYSFPIEAGKHSISLRTYDREIFIPEVNFEANKKTYLSFDLQNIFEKIHVTKKSEKLSPDEIKFLNEHFILINGSYETTFLQQGSKIYPCNQYYSVVGPFEEGLIKGYRDNQTSFEFPKRNDLTYTITYQDSLISEVISDSRRKTAFNNYRLSKYKREQVDESSYHHVAHTQADVTKLFNTIPYVYKTNDDKEKYTQKKKGSFSFSTRVSYDRILLFNDRDTTTLYKDIPVWYNLSPGLYSLRAYNKDTLKLSLDQIKIVPDRIYMKRMPDSAYYYSRDPDGVEPATYERDETNWSHYQYDDKHHLQKIEHSLRFKPGHLLTFDLIPDVVGTIKKYKLIGFSSKATFFHGDVPSVSSAGFGIHYINKFSRRFAMRKELSLARIGGTGVVHSPVYLYYSDSMAFRNNIWQYSTSLVCDLVSKRIPFNLYGTIGLGILYSNPKRFVDGKWVPTHGRSDFGYYPRLNLYLPVGGGMRFKLAKRTDLELDWTYNFAFTDYLDDAVSDHEPNPIDGYSLLSLRLNYIFSQPRPKVRTARYRHDEDGFGGILSCPSFDGGGVELGYGESTITGMAYKEENKFQVASFADFDLGQADQDVTSNLNAYNTIDDLSPLRRNGFLVKDQVKGQVVVWDLNPTYFELNEAMSVNTGFVRKDFRDYGYWQPNLITNDSGKVSFQISFPGNITKWNTYVLGMNGRQSGTTFASTRSFKPLITSLYVPRFMIEGDEAYVNGKTLNYTGDTLQLKSAFVIGDDTTGINEKTIIRTISERQKITTAEEDTISITYTSRLANGYTDGEERTIPIFRKGVEETKGLFLVLPKDSSFSLSFDTTLGPTTIYVDNNSLDVLLKEIESIKEYPYYCTEQAASKLDALLSEKTIREHLGQPFRGNAEIKSLIKRLRKGQKGNGTFGWWQDSPTDPYMTLHITKILRKARDMGYESPYPGEALKMYHYGGTRKDDHPGLTLRYLNTMTDLDVKLDYKKIIDSLDTRLFALHEKLELIRLKQIHKLGYNLDEILKEKKETFLGSVYFGEEGYHLYNNSIQTTLLAYDILRREGKHENLLQGMRNYFMEQRKSGHWNNTYESAKILEMILPDVLKDTKNQPSQVAVNNQVIRNFPYKEEFKGNTLSLEKKGSMVYFTAYQKSWNKNPEKLEKVFKVETKFLYENKPLDILTAGKNTTMQVKVKAEKEGRYVMIEIPIPAGCTYDQKSFAQNPNEVHREYFKDRVVIFCELLPPGEHEFSLLLQPRFSGSFTVNPTKVELMYYPTFNGRNELKKLKIIELINQ